LEDHVLAIVGPFLLNSPISFIAERDLNKEDADEYVEKGTGYYSGNAASGLGYLTTSVAEDKSWADIQPFQNYFGISEGTADDLNMIFGLREGIFEKFLEPYLGQDANFGIMNVGRPKSSGNIRLRSNNPEDKPLIDPKYYDHPDDVTMQVEGK
jgi:choline dehydrogenase